MVIQRQMRIGIVVTIFLSIFFLWTAWPTQYYFLNDDFLHIPRAAQGNFTYGLFLRPLSDLSLWFDHVLWAKNATGYHLTNTLIHLINTFLIYLLARQLFAGYGHQANMPVKSWLAAIFFLLYAFHSEPVFWIIGRGGSLSTLFFLLSCICYLKRHTSPSYFIFSIFSFCLGLLVYESIWIFPLVAFFLSAADIFSKKRMWRKERIYLVWVVSIFILYLAFRYYQSSVMANDYEIKGLTDGRLWKMAYNYNSLVARSFLPPMADYRWFVLSYVTLLIVSGTGIFHIIKKKKATALLWLLAVCFAVSLLPVVSLGINTHNTESERFIYLPSVFCALLIIEFIFLLTEKVALSTLLVFLFVAGHACLFWRASLDYRIAGNIAKNSLECIGQGRVNGTVYLIHLPSQYRGALIFRSGLEPATAWIDPGMSYQRMAILSKDEILQDSGSLSCRERDLVEAAAAMNARIGTDSAGKGRQVIRADGSFTFIPGRDRIFYWDDFSLIKIGQ
jgi:hypothetical protein